jgi:hypothetical protein
MTPADEWVTGIKEGYRTKKMKVGNCTVTVHRPILDDQERARREQQVIEALRGLIKKGSN